VSDTPRTDAKAQFFGFNPDEGEEFVQADFARELEREYAALESLIIKEGYIITNFNGEMALCRDPWHQPKEEQP
jgi:hypothetical protein